MAKGKRKINWEKVFDTMIDRREMLFTQREIEAANDWRVCVIGEYSPEYSRKFDNEVYNEEVRGPYETILNELGVAFGDAVREQQIDIAESIYRAIKILVRRGCAKRIKEAMEA